MQAAIDNVAQSFILKRPIPAEQADISREQATRLAMQLLENYQRQLGQRVTRPD